jgi:hypothetical protein
MLFDEILFGITARFHMSHIVKSDAIRLRLDILFHNDNHDYSVETEQLMSIFCSV